MGVVLKRYLRRLKYLRIWRPWFLSNEVAMRMRLIQERQIDCVLDVGANAGQYGSLLRGLGYRGKIVSFEPLSEAYRQLNLVAAGDANWETHHCGLGDVERECEINVSRNLQSSSILEMLPEHSVASPESIYCASERINVRTLNQALPKLVPAGAKIYLKIDTQGYEKQVLMGANEVLEKITGIQLEMAILPLYQGETLFDEMIVYLREKGFSMMSIEPGMRNPKTGQLLQMDGIFFRV